MAWTQATQVLENKILKNGTSINSKKHVTVYAADGAINPEADIVKLTKASAAAMTLAAPSEDQDGHELVILSGSAYAHVVTATNLLEDGVTGGAKDTATFAAFVGAAITLIAIGGAWVVKSKNVVTVAAV